MYIAHRSATKRVATGVCRAGDASSRGLPAWAVPGADTVALAGSLVLSTLILSIAGGHPKFAWVGWVVLVPLFIVIRTCRPLTAGLYGAMWGVCAALVAPRITDILFPGGVSTLWLAEGGAAWILGPASLTIAIFVPAFYALAGAWLTRLVGFSPLILGTGWIGAEIAFMAYAPHLSLFRCIGDFDHWSHWLAGMLGYAFVAFVAAYVNSLIVETITRVPRLGAAASRVIRNVCDLPRIVASQTASFVITHSVGPHPARAPPIRLIA